MALQDGDTLPDLPLKTVAGGTMGESSVAALFGAGRHVLFAVPGAFTPTCSAKHLPGFVTHFDAIKAKGIGTVACLSVNDAFVMKAWAEAGKAGDIVMIADGNADFSRALGLDTDASAYGMGIRCRRFAMIINDGVVERLLVEEPGSFSVSSAEHILGLL